MCVNVPIADASSSSSAKSPSWYAALARPRRSHTYFDGRRPRELPQVPAAVLGREAPHVVRHAAAGEVQVDGVVYIKMVDGVVDLCVENVASMARVSDGVACTPSPRCIETLNPCAVHPPRRDRFEVRVRAAAEQLARRLAGGLSAAPRLAGGEGRASVQRGSDTASNSAIALRAPERMQMQQCAVCSVRAQRSK